MRFLALLALAAALPLAAVAGYVLNPDPAEAPPTIRQRIEQVLKPHGPAAEDWLYLVTKGPMAGSTADAVMVATLYTPKMLKAAGAADGVFIVLRCTTYSTTGSDQKAEGNRQVVNYCTQRQVTKAQVRKHSQAELRGPSLTG